MQLTIAGSQSEYRSISDVLVALVVWAGSSSCLLFSIAITAGYVIASYGNKQRWLEVVSVFFVRAPFALASRCDLQSVCVCVCTSECSRKRVRAHMHAKESVHLSHFNARKSRARSRRFAGCDGHDAAN